MDYKSRLSVGAVKSLKLYWSSNVAVALVVFVGLGELFLVCFCSIVLSKGSDPFM